MKSNKRFQKTKGGESFLSTRKRRDRHYTSKEIRKIKKIGLLTHSHYRSHIKENDEDGEDEEDLIKRMAKRKRRV